MLHTELFTEWIANNGGAENALPALFAQVPDITSGTETIKFSDTFILHFCDKEIGFETEELFALKLEARARLILPPFIDKINTLAKISIDTAGEKEEITHSGTDTFTENLNRTTATENLSTNYNLPDSGATGETPVPSYASEQNKNSGTITESGTPSNTTTYGKKITTSRTPSKFDTVSLIDKIQNDMFNMWEEIFKRFDCLFMGVV
ncbi:MAG: hypothetical protein PUI31_04060 [Clostridia bacterium]|nr:hypothetical protein [Clostridia bacterium]